MFQISAIETVITIGAAQNEIRGLQLGQFILSRSKGEKTQSRQLSRIKLLARIGKQQPQTSALTAGNKPWSSVCFIAAIQT